VVSYIPTFLFFFLTATMGLVMYAYFEGCDPLISRKVSKPDQMIPLLVINVFRNAPGMAGLFASAVVSGALRYFLFKFVLVLLSDIQPSLVRLVWSDICPPDFHWTGEKYAWLCF